MQIGIIGAGKIGSTVGRLWAKAGHKVRFATRHPDELWDLAKEVGDNASIGTSEDAAWFGEVVFVAVPFGAWPALANIERGEGRGGCRQPRPRPRRKNG